MAILASKTLNALQGKCWPHLSVQGGSGVVRRQGVPWHLAPGVVLWGWLRVPHVTSIACTAAQYCSEVFAASSTHLPQLERCWPAAILMRCSEA